MTQETQLLQILQDAKALAREYHALTGKPLGITGEVAEYEAARLLNLTLTPARQAGYDATDAQGRTYQIKGRRVLNKKSQRVGGINMKKDWEAVLLVLLDEDFNATAIFEAPRNKLLHLLSAPGSKARNERGAPAVSQFIKIASKRWSKD